MIYDMSILMCTQNLTYASLIYRTEPETKKKKKRTKNKNGYRVCSEETMPVQKPFRRSRQGQGQALFLIPVDNAKNVNTANGWKWLREFTLIKQRI